MRLSEHVPRTRYKIYSEFAAGSAKPGQSSMRIYPVVCAYHIRPGAVTATIAHKWNPIFLTEGDGRGKGVGGLVV